MSRELHLTLRTALPAMVLVVAAAHAAQAPGMSWDSIRTLPDFSGPWNILPPPKMPDPPVLPALQQAAGAAAAAERDGVDPASIGLETIFCQPPRFTGYNKGDNTDFFEILFTPGRVTVTNELGLVRRIRLSNSPLPPGLEETNTGFSIGHWEGATLVLETGGLKHDTFILRNPALKLGANAHVVERLSLPEPGVLEVRTRITAPALLAAPYETTLRYRRYPEHEVRETVSCDTEDRSYDHAAGREKFDLTPPPDLPPPPSREGKR